MQQFAVAQRQQIASQYRAGHLRSHGPDALLCQRVSGLLLRCGAVCHVGGKIQLSQKARNAVLNRPPRKSRTMTWPGKA
jgi:hypothetical protein